MKFDRTTLSKAFFPNFRVTVLTLIFASLGLGFFVILFIAIIMNANIKRDIFCSSV